MDSHTYGHIAEKLNDLGLGYHKKKIGTSKIGRQM